MSQNKILGIWIASIMAVSCILTIGVIAHDRDLAIIDHFFDFHLNEDAVKEEIARKTLEEKARAENIQKWVDEIKMNDPKHDWQESDRGTVDTNRSGSDGTVGQ